MRALDTVPPAEVDVARLRRVVAIGGYGSGKTTLSGELGGLLGVPVHHLDALRWRPGWQLVPMPEWRALSEQLVREESWIIDGNFEHTLDIRLARAETVLFLDVPLAVSLWRVLRRRLSRAPRHDLAPGLVETLNLRLLRLMWAYRRTVRPHLLELLRREGGNCQIVVLRGRRDVEALLAAVRAGGRPSRTAAVEREPQPGADVAGRPA